MARGRWKEMDIEWEMLKPVGKKRLCFKGASSFFFLINVIEKLCLRCHSSLSLHKLHTDIWLNKVIFY